LVLAVRHQTAVVAALVMELTHLLILNLLLVVDFLETLTRGEMVIQVVLAVVVLGMVLVAQETLALIRHQKVITVVMVQVAQIHQVAVAVQARLAQTRQIPQLAAMAAQALFGVMAIITLVAAAVMEVAQLELAA
jgi:hypothetical protein